MKSTRHKPILFAIGHSTRPIEIFIELLRAHGVREVVDIRTIPKSRHNPQFNGYVLSKSLRSAGIQYKHLEKLGGLRRTRPDSINLGWENKSFRGYADYMAMPEFEKGLRSLEAVAHKRPTAMMCAEAVPWRCHRSLVADAVTKRGWLVRHIQSRKTAKRHKLTPFLKMRKRILTYPAMKISHKNDRSYD